RLQNASVDLKPGVDIAPSDLAELLVDAGFTREDPADERGEFALRGGILDIYPAGGSAPVRLEVLGDTIEAPRTHDPGTQRSVAPVRQLTVVPLLDRLGDDRSASLFDYLARAKESRILVSEPDEVRTNLDKHAEQTQRSFDEVSGSRGVDRARREPETDFFDAEDEEEQDSEGASGSSRTETVATSRTETSRTPILPPSELFVDVDTIGSRLDSGIALIELGVEEVEEGPGLPARPVRS